MTIMKTAAAAAFVAVAALASGMSPAEAKGKKHWGKHGLFHHHHFHHNHKFHKHGVIVIGTGYSCKKWLHRYHKTGKKIFLHRYYACKY